MTLLLVTLAIALAVTATRYEVGPGRPYRALQEIAPLLGPGDLVEAEGDAVYPVVPVRGPWSRAEITPPAGVA